MSPEELLAELERRLTEDGAGLWVVMLDGTEYDVTAVSIKPDGAVVFEV